MGKENFTFGQTVRCTVTGFAGKVVGTGQFMHENDAALVQPEVNKEGVIPKSVWIQNEKLEVVDATA